MTSFYYKAKRVKEPILNVTHEQADGYGTSLSTLNQAWSSIAETKKELRAVNSKIRQSTVGPAGYCTSNVVEQDLATFPRKDPSIERRVVYDDNVKFRKENIPPKSYPQPTLQCCNDNYDPHRFQTHHRGNEENRPVNRYDVKVNSSLTNLSLLARERKSEALKRLKDRISKQKETSNSFNEGEDFPEKLHHSEEDIIPVPNEEIDQPVVRKITTAPAAPVYKGFNQPNTVPVKTNEARKEKILKKPITIIKSIKKGNVVSKHVKGSKGNKKQHRIVAPKKLPNAITTSSWRAGREIEKQVKKELKSKLEPTRDQKKQPKEPVELVQTNIIESKKDKDSTNIKIDESESNNISSGGKTDRDVESISEQNTASSVPDNLPSDDQTVKSETKQKEDFDHDDISKLQGISKLSKNAKDILAGMHVEQETLDNDVGKERTKKPVKAVVDTGLSKRAKRSPPVKRKRDEETNPIRKVRHYDQTEVQKYMMKQQAERKKQRLKHKEEERRQKELKEIKINELFEKQKAAVNKSSTTRKKHTLGYTFTKHKDMNGYRGERKANKEWDILHKQKNVTKEFSREIFSHDEISTSSQNAATRSHTSFVTQSQTTTGSQSQTSTSRSLHSSSDSSDESQDDWIGRPFTHIQPDYAYDAGKADRVAAIRATATALRERLNLESQRLTSLVSFKKHPESTIPAQRLSPPVNSKKHSESTILAQQLSPPTLHPGNLSQLPGVHNVDAQAELNVRLREMEAAANKIQAAYRGHTVRQNLRTWKLPSGRTLYQSLEEARRRAFLSDLTTAQPSLKLASDNHSPIKIKSSHIIEAASSTDSLLSEALKDSNHLLDATDNSSSRASHRKTESQTSDDTFPSYKQADYVSPRNASTLSTISGKTLSSTSGKNVSMTPRKILSPTLERTSLLTSERTVSPISQRNDPSERLRKILEKYKDVPADKYSVINIFTRNYPSLRKQQLTQELSPTGTETELIIADAYTHEKSEATSLEGSLTEQKQSLTEQDESLAEQEESLAEQDVDDASSNSANSTLIAPNLSSTNHFNRQSNSHEFVQKNAKHSPPQTSYRSLLSPKSKRSASSSSDMSEKLFSPSMENMKNKSHDSAEIPKSFGYPIIDDSDEVSMTSANPSPTLFSDTAYENEINPVLTSTKRSPKNVKKDEDDKDASTPLTRNINFNRCDGRMSPNALERRLRAEINLFDSVGDSLQQMHEMDRIRDIVQAQQETVSLAQLLKNRQSTYQQEIEKMSLEARERAAKSAQNIEVAKRNAAEASANAIKAIAEIKTKASEDVAQSTKQLAQVQNEATSLSLNAIKETERARQNAFDVYEQSVERRLANMEGVVTTAASAASGAAVEIALKQYRDRLENLRTKSLQKVSESYASSSTASTSGRSYTKTSESPSSSKDSSNRTITEDIQSKQRDKQSFSSHTKSSNTPSNRTIIEDIQSKQRDKQSFSSHTKSSNTFEESSSASRKMSHSVPDEAPEDMTAVSEEIPQSEDNELAEALFISARKETSIPDESIHSNFSEEKFHLSLTEDELKRDFRQVLPSENHRRKSLDHRDYIISGNETSSDELTPRMPGMSMSRKSSKSPFVAEDTFARFTTDMVRQYVHEEHVRAKHQKALLKIREKAIVEKTKAEMAYLEMQKKTLHKKGVDDKMPPIAKKQRALMKKLEVEQAEIQRLKKVHKAASDERLYMLQQEEEIRHIQKSTRKIWNEVGSFQNNSNLATNEDISEVKVPDEKSASFVSALDEKTSVVSEQLSEQSIPDASINTTKDDSILSKSEEISEQISNERKSTVASSVVTPSLKSSHRSSKKKRSLIDDLSRAEKSDDEEVSSVSHDLDKLKYMASRKYLTEREKKLDARKQKFSEIMERESKLKDWRRKVLDEEMRLKADIKRVLHHEIEVDGGSEIEGSIVSQHYSNESAKRSNISRDTSHQSLLSDKRSPTTSIVEEELGGRSDEAPKSSKSVSDIFSCGGIAKNAVTEKSSSTLNDNFRYSNDTFEDLTKTNKLSSKGRKHDEDSWTEGTSDATDASDTEQRLKALEHELRRRKTELQKLRKKKERESLRKKEEHLKNELQVVEQQIDRESKETWSIESNHSPANKISTPRVLSPRSSVENILLPEKINIPSDKESRRSLHFSDAESRSEKLLSLDERIAAAKYDSPGKSDNSRKSDNSHKSNSHRESDSSRKSDTSILSDRSSKRDIKASKDTRSQTSPVIRLVHQNSLDEISENILSHSETSHVSEDVKIASTAGHDSSSTHSSHKSDLLDNIYDDNFFDSDSSTRDNVSSVQENILDNERTETSIRDDSVKSDGSSIHVSLSEHLSHTSNKHEDSMQSEDSLQSNQPSDIQETHNKSESPRSIVEDNKNARSIVDNSQSVQYSSKFESAVSEELSPQKSNERNESSMIPDSKPENLSSKHSTVTTSVTSAGTSSDTLVHPDEKPNTTSFCGFRINDRVKVEDIMLGTIRYLGKTPFSPVLVAGIELDQPTGTNNGTFQGQQYFSCPDDHGFFTTVEKLKIFNDNVSTAVDDLSASQKSPFAENEADELLEQTTVKSDDSYSKDFELSSAKSSRSKTTMEELKPSLSTRTHSPVDELRDDLSFKQSEIIDELDFQSSSDLDTLSGGEIPSPAKLDLQPIVENITDGILSSIVSETFAIVSPRSVSRRIVSRDQDTDESKHDVDPEVNESYTVGNVRPATFAKQNVQQENTVDSATKTLLNDAVSAMLSVMREKDSKLQEQEDRSNNRTANIFSMLTGDEKDGYDPNNKHKYLQDVHNQLDMLLGDDDELDEGDEDAVETEIQSEKQRPVVMKVPLNGKVTQNIVTLALEEIHRCEMFTDTLSQIKIPESILSMSIDNVDELDEESTMLYKTLIFDIALHLYSEIKEFGELQTSNRPPWLKIPRKTFSKFIRHTHLFEDDLTAQISRHVCTSMNIEEGRPSLTYLKRKLPLNLAKKDYVDAVLVEELREEEAQWVNYDEDELRVKYQLADNILESLLEETANMISDILETS